MRTFIANHSKLLCRNTIIVKDTIIIFQIITESKDGQQKYIPSYILNEQYSQYAYQNTLGALTLQRRCINLDWTIALEVCK